jgi:hypothetical protein
MGYRIQKFDYVWISSWVGVPLEVEVDRFFSEYLEALEECSRLQKKLLIINDFTNAQPPTPIVRKKVAQYFKEAGLKREWISHSIFVVNNAVIRGAITAVSWFAPKMKTITIVSTIEQAAKLAIDILSRNNLPISHSFLAAMTILSIKP